MSRLIDQRCWHHVSREAVARCPACHRYYCRECVTEHRGRMICAECAAAENRPDNGAERSRAVLWTGFAMGGMLLAWLIFYYLGMFLARVPSDFFDKPA